MYSVDIQIHAYGLDYRLKLEEQESVTDETFCINDTNFRLSLEGEPTKVNATWERIAKLDHQTTSLGTIVATILDVESLRPENEERLKLLSGVNALAERYLKDRRKEAGHSFTYRLTEQSLESAGGRTKEHLESDDFNEKLADRLLEPLRGRLNHDWEILTKKVEEYYKVFREADLEVFDSKQASMVDISAKIKGVLKRVEREFSLQKLDKHKVALLELGFEKLQLRKSQQDNQYLLSYLLELAISVDHIAYVNDLFQAGAKADVNHVFYAVVGNSVPMMRNLVRHGTSFSLDKLLKVACIRGKKSEQALFELLRLGAKLDAKDEDGVTPMMHAMSSNLPVSSLKKLLNHIEDVNQADNDGDTLLVYAIRRQLFFPDLEIVKEIVNRGAIPNTKDNLGRTPLHTAAKDCPGSNLEELIRILIDCGAVPTAIDIKERTPFHSLGSNYRLDAQQLIKAMKELIRGGGKVNAQDYQGKTLLHYYTILADPSVVTFLAKNGINLNLKDDQGNTPLHIAASELMVLTVEALLDHGANKFVQNKRQKLPGAMPIELDPEKPKTLKILSLLSKPSSS